MRFDCETCHGKALATAERTQAGAKVSVEWGIDYGTDTAKKIDYHFAPPMAPLADASTPLREFALLALSHFHRTDLTVPGATQHCRIEDMKPDGELRLQPLT
jgi:hypothetical protein